MPIASGPTSVVPGTPIPDPPVVPQVPVQIPHPGVFQPVWFAPDGTVWELNPDGDRLFTFNAATGYGAAPVNITSDPDPQGGVTIRFIQSRPRTVTWPLRIRGTSHMEFLTRWREYSKAFTQTRRLGPGVLRITRPDGKAREIQGVYQSGFDFEPGQGWVEDTPVVSIFCPDPFWRDAETTVIQRSYSEGVAFLAPYFTLSSGSVLGETTIDNTGDVNAYPSWVIVGPATEIVATNNTTGQTFTVTHTLDEFEQITIETRPASIVGPIGQNLADALNWPTAELWPLEPGINEVDFSVDGAGPGTLIQLSYFQRYETS